jgi:hypothetical protein
MAFYARKKHSMVAFENAIPKIRLFNARFRNFGYYREPFVKIERLWLWAIEIQVMNGKVSPFFKFKSVPGL